MADAARELPSEEKVRELTAQPDLAPEEANRYGDLFLEAGKFPQAMMFYERSRDPERLARVKRLAVEKGDAFLLHGVTRLAPDLVTPEEWKAAGDRAFQAGKFLFARDCYEKAGDAERAQAAREAWLKIFAA
jgi:tetratricopeptide (TPR) repeat protein